MPHIETKQHNGRRPRTFWDPDRVLDLVNPDKGMPTCTGEERRFERRCLSFVPRTKLNRVYAILDDLAEEEPFDAAAAPELRRAAELTLCQVHKDQAAMVEREWREMLNIEGRYKGAHSSSQHRAHRAPAAAAERPKPKSKSKSKPQPQPQHRGRDEANGPSVIGKVFTALSRHDDGGRSGSRERFRREFARGRGGGDDLRTPPQIEVRYVRERPRDLPRSSGQPRRARSPERYAARGWEDQDHLRSPQRSPQRSPMGTPPRSPLKSPLRSPGTPLRSPGVPFKTPPPPRRSPRHDPRREQNGRQKWDEWQQREQEGKVREEEERQRAEELRRAQDEMREKTEKAAWANIWTKYEAQWDMVPRTPLPGETPQTLRSQQVPWPVRSGHIDDVTVEGVQEFFERGSKVSGRSGEEWFQLMNREMRKWHQDKILSRFRDIGEYEKSAIQTVVSALVHIRKDAQENRGNDGGQQGDRLQVP